jgi:arylsulfatase A-like enzyme
MPTPTTSSGITTQSKSSRGADYRERIASAVLSGISGGFLAGVLIGLGEAAWVFRVQPGFDEGRAYIWAIIAYPPTLAFIGFAVSCVMLVITAFRARGPATATSVALSFGATIALGGWAVAMYHLSRDVLDDRALSVLERGLSMAVAAGIGVVAAAFTYFAMSWLNTLCRRMACGLILCLACAIVATSAAYRVTDNEARPLSEAVADASAPPVILIAIDTLRADYLGLYNREAVADTPAIEAFARDSLQFTNAYAQTSWTKPSFASIFTSLYPESHGAVSKNAVLPDAVVTLSECLHDAGYYTQGFANNPNITRVSNYDQGFDEYVDLPVNLYFGAAPSVTRLFLYQVLRRLTHQLDARLLNRRIVITDFYRPAPYVTDTALTWLESPARPVDQPYFLFLHYMDPHDPYRNPDGEDTGYARVQFLLREPDPAAHRERFTRAYINEIEYLDRHLARLFKGLKERGLYDDAVIVLLSDHGEEFHDHGGWWHGRTLYEEQIRVPLVVKLPENREGGGQIGGFARLIDVAPTVLHLADATVPGVMSGRVLIDRLGIARSQGPETLYASVDFEGCAVQAVRTEAMKLIQANAENPRGLEPVELYDLEVDFGELNSLAGQGHSEEPVLAAKLTEMRALSRGAAPQARP